MPFKARRQKNQGKRPINTCYKGRSCLTEQDQCGYGDAIVGSVFESPPEISHSASLITNQGQKHGHGV